MSVETVWFQHHNCLWDVICRRQDHDQLVFACYFRREAAQKEVDRLRKEYPFATVCVRASDWHTYTIIHLPDRCLAMIHA